MMMTNTLRTALTTALVAMGAASAQAQTPGSVGNELEIRVINNYASAVRVYAEDSFGRTKSLGWVNHSDAKTLTLPTEMTKLGPVDIKVFSDRPVLSPRAVPDGVRTMPLNLRPGDAVSLWLQTDLTDSWIQVVRS